MESVLAGVRGEEAAQRLIAIHDGARPLITEELIKSTVFAADEYMAAAPAIEARIRSRRWMKTALVTGHGR